MTHSSDFTPGQIVAGQYEIRGILGRGGSATVYHAVRVEGGSRIALKVMHEGLTDGVGERERFAREAALAQQLRHPHIVRMLDYGYTESDQPYLAFALLVGRTLDVRLREEGGLQWLEVGRLSAQVLRALEKAHSLEIVHRDIKPGNIFLVRTPLGEVAQVLDFGLAKAVGQQQENDELTRVGSVLGTPRYLSPEQARGETVGPAADIYSFGLVMAEMLSGQPVVAGTTHFEMFVQHGSDAEHELPLEALDSPFAAIIRRAVDKEPTVRYRLASQMLADVEAVIERLEEGQETEDEDSDDGDFIVTQMLDPSKAALPGVQGSATSEQLRKAFNLLARKSRPGAKGLAAALASPSTRPAAPSSPSSSPRDRGPLSGRPTRPPQHAASANPTANLATPAGAGHAPQDAGGQRGPRLPSADSLDDEPTHPPPTDRIGAAGAAAAGTVDDPESEPEPATCVADFDMLGLAPGAQAPPGGGMPAASPAAQPRDGVGAAPPTEAQMGLPSGSIAGGHTALIDTSGWPSAAPLGASAPGSPPAAAVDLGATAYLPSDEPTFEPPPAPAAAPQAIAGMGPAAFASGGQQPNSAWAAAPAPPMPTPQAMAPEPRPSLVLRWLMIVLAVAVAVAAGAAVRLWLWR